MRAVRLPGRQLAQRVGPEVRGRAAERQHEPELSSPRSSSTELTDCSAAMHWDSQLRSGFWQRIGA